MTHPTFTDPIGLNGGMNTYGYVGGNPVNQIDKFGLAATLGQPLTFADYASRTRSTPNPAGRVARVPFFGWGLAIGMYLGSKTHDYFYPEETIDLDSIKPLPKPEYTIDDIIQMSESSADDGDTCPVPGEEGERHSPDREALNDLVNELTNKGRKPLTSDDADTMLDWADELGVPGSRDDRDTDHWKGGPHIHIPGTGSGRHIPAKPKK